MSDLTLRDAATDIGISHSTLSRIETGEAMDGDTLAAVIRWLLTADGNAPKGKRAA